MLANRFMKNVSTVALCWVLAQPAFGSRPGDEDAASSNSSFFKEMRKSLSIGSEAGLPKLTEIRDLRRYFNKGNLEITSTNYEALTKASRLYEAAFSSYEKGVIVKGWDSSLGFDPLVDLLLSFSHIKSFKMGINWNKDGDVIDLLSKSIQFYEDLEDLDISGCRLKDASMSEILEAFQNPDKLRILDVRDNALKETTLKALQIYFKNLTSLHSDITLPPLVPTQCPQAKHPL